MGILWGTFQISPATAARHAAGLTQSGLARAAGIDPTTLSRMETSGTKPVTSRHLQTVLDALRVNGVEVLEDGLRRTKKHGEGGPRWQSGGSSGNVAMGQGANYLKHLCGDVAERLKAAVC